MRRRPHTLLLLGAFVAAGLLTILAAPSPARAQPAPIELLPVGATQFDVAAGSRVRLRVEMLVAGSPAPGQLVDWFIVSTTAGATGPSQSTTDASGIATARFDVPGVGSTQIEAFVSGAPPVLFTINTTAVVPPPGPGPGPTPTVVELLPEGPTAFDLVLGDRQALGVRTVTPNGAPVGGVEVKFAVVSSPGSPGVGRSDTTVATGADGKAFATFGFSTAGPTLIRASVVDPRVGTDSPPIDFAIDTASLGDLTPERRSYRSAAEALDQICLNVFVDEAGNQRPSPEATPLCVYMTGTVDNREGRAQAIREITDTGIGAQTSTAFSGLVDQVGSVQSRLAALRGGAVRGAIDQLALTLDGVTLSNDVLAAAGRDSARSLAFDQAIDAGFARLYAGLDAAQDPAGEAAAVAPMRDRPWGFFVTGRLTRGDSSEGAEETGFEFDTIGVTAGFDRSVGANGFLGFALSALQNETDLDGGGGSLDNDSLGLILYGIREWEHGYLQLVGSLGQNSFDQRRRIDLPVVGDLVARSSFDGDQYGLTLELGGSFDGSAGSLTVFGRGSWARASVDGYTETGAVATIPGTGFGPVDFGLEVGDQELDSLLGEAGLDWGRAFSTAAGLVIPQLTATWAHEFDNESQLVHARFLGDVAAGSSFFVFTDEPDRDWLNVGAALRFQFLWGSLFLAYDRDFQRDDLETENFNAGLRFEF